LIEWRHDNRCERNQSRDIERIADFERWQDDRRHVEWRRSKADDERRCSGWR
jgi:hypothetical protein